MNVQAGLCSTWLEPEIHGFLMQRLTCRSINAYISALRCTQENILLLKEENQSLKKKMERFEDKMKELAKNELENQVSMICPPVV